MLGKGDLKMVFKKGVNSSGERTVNEEMLRSIFSLTAKNTQTWALSTTTLELIPGQNPIPYNQSYKATYFFGIFRFQSKSSIRDYPTEHKEETIHS